MSKEVKTFALAYGSIAGNLQKLAKEEIMKACGWKSSQVFSMKKNGERALNEQEEVMVEHVMRKWGFNAWTGEKISA